MLCGFWTFLLERDHLNYFFYSLKGRRFCCGCVCSFKRKKKKKQKKQTEVLLLSTINTELGIQTVMCHLKTPHVSRVPCILQAVLVTLQEELEEEPARARETNSKRTE